MPIRSDAPRPAPRAPAVNPTSPGTAKPTAPARPRDSSSFTGPASTSPVRPPGAVELTPATLGLPPGKLPIPASAVVADALELYKQPGVTAMAALTRAATALGYPLSREMDSGHPLRLYVALGPAALPLIPVQEWPDCLSRWSLKCADVIQLVVELGTRSPVAYEACLEALVNHPNVTPQEQLALADALVRTARAGEPQAPVLDGSVTLDRLVEATLELGQGQTFAKAVAMVGNLLREGAVAAPERVRALADLALGSPDLVTRAQAAGLFWRSSQTSAPAVRAYLDSVITNAPGWSRVQYVAAIDQLNRLGQWGMPTRAGGIAEELIAQVVGSMVRAAPPDAPLDPLVEVGTQLDVTNLAGDLTEALSRSTLDPQRLVRLVDLVMASSWSRESAKLLGRLLREHPELCASAPNLCRQQLNLPHDVELSTSDAFKKLVTAPNYLDALRALPVASPHQQDVIDTVLKDKPTREEALALLSTTRWPSNLGWSRFAVAGGLNWGQEDGLAMGRELGLSADEMLDALPAEHASPIAGRVLTALLLDPTCSDEKFQARFAQAFATADLSTGQYASRPAGEPNLTPDSDLELRRAQAALLVALRKRGFDPPTVARLLTAVAPNAESTRAFLDAGFPPDVVAALAAQPDRPRLQNVPSAFASGGRVQANMRELQEMRIAGFRQHIASVQPAPLPPNYARDFEAAFDSPQRRKMRLAFSPEALRASPSELEAMFGPPAENPSDHFMVDVRKGLSYADLRARYSELPLAWGIADSAPPGRQFEVLLKESRSELSGLAAFAAVASPTLDPAVREQVLLRGMALDWRAVTSADGTDAVLRSLTVLQGGSLDFLVAPIEAALPRAIAAASLGTLGTLVADPRMSKAAALRLAWSVAVAASPNLTPQAERGVSQGPDPYEVERHSMSKAFLLNLAAKRADLTEPERAELLRAVTYLSDTSLRPVE